ncbi:ECF-type sigma factor [bacterium]|nr:ECF-type sigma factor [bacterium]
MPKDVTQLLETIETGDPKAAADLLPHVYDELRRIAALRMANEPDGHTLQATALVHEAWIRLSGENHEWKNRRHFLGTAAEAMRRILIDRARKRKRNRHGGDMARINLDDVDLAATSNHETVMFVNEALDRLREKDPEIAELIKLRFFVGIRSHDAARLLGMSERTARRNWAYARAWLAQELLDQGSEPNP